MPTFPTLQAEIAFSGKSLSFDGTDDYVEKASPTNIPSGGSARTIAAWIKPTNVDPGGTVLGYGGASGQSFNVQVFRTAGSTYLFTDGVNAGNNITLTGGEIPTAGVWSHVAFVLSSSTAWAYYLNGVLTKSGTFPVAINTTAPTALRIGNRTDVNQNFPGLIDDVRVWNVARTEAQILADKDRELVGNETNLVAYWKFNEGSGTNANDETANNNDGTITGATWSNEGGVKAWTDVSEYLLPTVNTKRGRQRELDKFQPGTFSFVLTNEDRRFDPTNTSSPYYPNVIPNRRVRIRAASGGKLGSALEFNAADSEHVAIPSASALNLSTVTVEAWVKTPGLTGNNGAIFDKSIGGSTNTAYLLFFEAGTLQWRIKPSGSFVTASAPSPSPTNTWIHAAGTFDGTTLRLYVDGVEVATNTSGALSTGAGVSQIGMLLGGFYPFNGIIDEVRVWNTARTASQIAADKDRELSGTESGLVGYWRFNEGEGTTAKDSTSNANHGTLTNGPTWKDPIYPVIDGYIDAWPPSWKVSTATVTVTATDGMKLLSRADMPEIFYVGEVLNDSPTAYYRLNETDNGHPMTDASGFSRNGFYVGNPIMGRADPITDGQDGAVDFNSGATRDYAQAPPEGTYSGTGGFSVEFWVLTSTATGLATMVCWESSGSTGVAIYIALGLITFRTIDDSGGSSQVTSTVTINNNAWRHIVCVRETDGTLRIYIDGSLHRSAAATTRNILKHLIFLGSGYAGAAPFNGWLDEVAIYPSALTASRVSAHYNARNSGLNDTTGARVGRVLDFANWPSSDRTIDTGQSTLQSETTLGSAADEIAKAADSEFGAFYISRDGKARFRERHAILKSPYTTPQLTLADDGTGHMYSNPELDYSDLEIRNDVTVQRNGGRPQHAKDDTSIDKYGLSSYSKTGLSNTSDNELRDAANSILQKYKEPFLQLTSVTLEPHAEDTDGTMWTQVLTRELEDRVRVKATPPGGGAIIDKEMHIQGISHQIGPGPRWITKWDLSQADATTTFWILGTGALDEDTALAF